MELTDKSMEHMLALKLLRRQIKIYLAELERIIPFREKEAIKEMETHIFQLTNTVKTLEKISIHPFVNDAVVIEYLDNLLRNKPDDVLKLTATDDDKVQSTIDICISHGAFGRAIRFANPEYFNQVKITIIDSL